MILKGNTLTVLRTYKTGEFKATITLGSGNYCRVRFELARETGKGNPQHKGIRGEDLEFVSARQIGSRCRITRG